MVVFRSGPDDLPLVITESHNGQLLFLQSFPSPRFEKLAEEGEGQKGHTLPSVFAHTL